MVINKESEFRLLPGLRLRYIDNELVAIALREGYMSDRLFFYDKELLAVYYVRPTTTAARRVRAWYLQKCGNVVREVVKDDYEGIILFAPHIPEDIPYIFFAQTTRKSLKPVSGVNAIQ
jgi:hypothetical protein